MSFSFSMAPLGETQEGLHQSIQELLSTAAENLHSHLIFMCLYFNGPPGAASLWNASSDTFTDHFHSPPTPERLQLNIFHEGAAQRKGRALCSVLVIVPFDEYFPSETERLRSLEESSI